MSTPGLERSVFASGKVDRTIHDRPVTRAMTICRTAGNPLVLLLLTMELPDRVRYRVVGTGPPKLVRGRDRDLACDLLELASARRSGSPYSTVASASSGSICALLAPTPLGIGLNVVICIFASSLHDSCIVSTPEPSDGRLSCHWD